MITVMTPPDRELALRLLAGVSYAQRLPAGRLRPPVGLIPGDLRSLRELYFHLMPDDKSLPGVNLAALAEWVETTLGDPELAVQIETALGRVSSHVEGCLAIYELVGTRLEQVRAAAGGEVPS